MPRLRLRYQTYEFGDEDIHLRSLRDLQEFSDDDGAAEALGISSARWSIFGVVWDAGRVLADLMVGYPVGKRRVLELGSGLALASLVLNRRGVDVSATDRHPDAGAFLAANTALNLDPPIPFVRACWSDEVDALGEFDLIIGSDVLYERHHASELAGFVLRHARSACEVVIVDAGRGERRGFGRTLADAGFVHDELPATKHGSRRTRIDRYTRDVPR